MRITMAMWTTQERTTGKINRSLGAGYFSTPCKSYTSVTVVIPDLAGTSATTHCDVGHLSAGNIIRTDDQTSGTTVDDAIGPEMKRTAACGT